MTTNHPEKLDEALIRPGRVDHQVSFSNASQTQIQELFECMYTNDLPKTKVIMNEESQVLEVAIKEGFLTPPITPNNPDESFEVNKRVSGTELGDGQLSDIARHFAEQVPGGMFSPAEIQGFLLKRKTEPRKALAEVGDWVKSMETQKAGGGRAF
jgi:mitochondrial chaperone BCS1